MSDPTRTALAQLLAEHAPEVAANWYGCSSCQMSFGDSASYAAHLAEMILARWTLAEGLAVGYIVRRGGDQADGIPVDEDDELMFDMWSYRHHTTLAQARRDLAKARLDEQALTDAEEPDERLKIYALTEIGEENE